MLRVVGLLYGLPGGNKKKHTVLLLLAVPRGLVAAFRRSSFGLFLTPLRFGNPHVPRLRVLDDERTVCVLAGDCARIQREFGTIQRRNVETLEIFPIRRPKHNLSRIGVDRKLIHALFVWKIPNAPYPMIARVVSQKLGVPRAQRHSSISGSISFPANSLRLTDFKIPSSLTSQCVCLSPLSYQ